MGKGINMKEVTISEINPMDIIVRQGMEFLVSSLTSIPKKNLVRIETVNHRNNTEYFIGEPCCTLTVKEEPNELQHTRHSGDR